MRDYFSVFDTDSPVQREIVKAIRREVINPIKKSVHDRVCIHLKDFRVGHYVGSTVRQVTKYEFAKGRNQD